MINRTRVVRTLIRSVLPAATLGMSLPCIAQTASPPFWGIDNFVSEPDPYWRRITEGDVRAAYKLLTENHPGAVAEVGDTDFTQRLAEALRIAKSRARTVGSYQGYVATLAGFANAMGDKHIWSRPTFIPSRPRWAGIAVSWRPGAYIVTDTEGSELAHLRGAVLIQCDGRAAEDLARANLGEFRAQWAIEAQRAQAAPMLFMDDGNPFIRRPQKCTFAKDGKQFATALSWRRWNEADLTNRLRKAVGSGAAGFGVRRLGDGYWISLQQLLGPAREVVDAVKREAPAMRASAFTVLDLRGNSGGTSGFGDEIARALMGDERVAAAQVKRSGCSDNASWRASPGNLAQSRLLLTELGPVNGPEFHRILGNAVAAIEQAMREGRELTGPAACGTPEDPAAPHQLPSSQLKGPLIVITDKKCFSSCLVVVEQLRRLGAYQVGQTTDANTHYLEVREQYLPSGYSTFSTLQALDPGAPRQHGPFVPDLIYDGDIADTAALETWVGNVALSKARAESRTISQSLG